MAAGLPAPKECAVQLKKSVLRWCASQLVQVDYCGRIRMFERFGAEDLANGMSILAQAL